MPIHGTSPQQKAATASAADTDGEAQFDGYLVTK